MSSKNNALWSTVAKYTDNEMCCGTSYRRAGARTLTLAAQIGSWPGVADWPANCGNTAPISCLAGGCLLHS